MTKHLVLAIILFLCLVGIAWAACTTYTIFLPDGTMQICQSCCYNGNCQITCF